VEFLEAFAIIAAEKQYAPKIEGYDKYVCVCVCMCVCVCVCACVCVCEAFAMTAAEKGVTTV
jgi:hypothetical protein